MKELLQIGDLARLGGVSIKALRFYDEQGILRPEHVDPQTGYRYYAVEQAQSLAQITNLRAIDFSIQEIADLLAADLTSRDLTGAIADKKRELRRSQAELDQKIRIADLITAISPDKTAGRRSAMRLCVSEDQHVYSATKTVASLGDPVTEMFETVEAIVAEQGLRAPAAPFLIFHDPPTKQSAIMVEVCIPISTPTENMDSVMLMAGDQYAVSTVYQGGYAQTAALYQQMMTWIDHAGLIACGPLREIYHRFGADQDDYRLPAKMLKRRAADYLTELLIPISLSHPTKETN